MNQVLASIRQLDGYILLTMRPVDDPRLMHSILLRNRVFAFRESPSTFSAQGRGFLPLSLNPNVETASLHVTFVG